MTNNNGGIIMPAKSAIDTTEVLLGGALQVADLTITELQTITAFGIGDDSGDYLFTLDELQDTTLSQSEEITEITGRGGRRLASLKQNKTVSISGTSGLISAGLLEMQTGGEFTDNTDTGYTIKRTEYVAVNTTTYAGTLEHALKNATVPKVYGRNAKGVAIKELVVQTEADPVATGKFKIDATGTKPLVKLATADVGSADDKISSLLVVYESVVTTGAYQLKNDSDKFASKCALYIDCIAEDKCANTYRVQIYIPKADFSGEFDISLGGDQTVQAFSAEALAGGFCGADTSAGTLWTWTVFTE